METRPDNLAETATYHLRENSGRGPVSNTCLSTTCIPNARRACVARVREVSVRAARRAARVAGAAQDRPCPEAGPQCSLETLARGEGRGAQ